MSIMSAYWQWEAKAVEEKLKEAMERVLLLEARLSLYEPVIWEESGYVFCPEP